MRNIYYILGDVKCCIKNEMLQCKICLISLFLSNCKQSKIVPIQIGKTIVNIQQSQYRIYHNKDTLNYGRSISLFPVVQLTNVYVKKSKSLKALAS